MDVRIGLWRKLSAEELVLSNCGVEKPLESPLDGKEIQPVYSKGNQSWIFIGRTDAKAETPILFYLMWRTDSLEKTLMLGGIVGRRRRDDRGWDGWMALPTRWTWVWVSSKSWWWTGKSGVLQSKRSKRVGHDWATELNWSKLWGVWKGHGLTHYTSVLPAWGPSTLPEVHGPWTFGYGRSAERPQKPLPALQGPPLSSQGLVPLAMFLHICLPAVRLQSKNEQDGAWGLLHLCWVGHFSSLGWRTQSGVGWNRIR